MATAVTEPPVRTLHRVAMERAEADTLLGRQTAWAAVQAIAGVAIAATALPALAPDLAFASALGLGLVASRPRRPLHGLGAAALIAGACVLAGAFAGADATIAQVLEPTAAAAFETRGLSGVQVLAAGAVAGLGVGWIDGGPRNGGRLLQLAAAGCAATGLGWWAANALVPTSWVPAAAISVKGVISGIIASQTLTVAALRFRRVTRIPSRRKIRSTLAPTYQGPALKACDLDRTLDSESPDLETRDGLGEVAAWVYRLQWTLQRLDDELERIGGADLERRIIKLTAEAEAEADAFTRDRKLATAQHLERLQEHRAALTAERTRTSALVDYAGVFLEEARAGLAVARMQPGDHTPARLQDVLGKLRAYSKEREAHRKTAREVAALATQP